MTRAGGPRMPCRVAVSTRSPRGFDTVASVINTVRMLCRNRRFIAVLTLTSLLSPWAVSAGVAFHVAEHSRGAHDHVHQSEEAGAIELMLHGHHHDQGTPAHPHVVVSARADAGLLATRPSLSAAPLALGSVLITVAAPAPLGPGVQIADTSPAPPDVPDTHSILRI